MARIQFLLVCLACAVLWAGVQAQRYTVDNWPNGFADYGDDVEFFYLLAPFPYNVPANISAHAGSGFNSYGAFHAGIGVWNIKDNTKISIELVANDYVGALFPYVNNQGVLLWNNSASIIITDPLVSSDWTRSTSITSTSGVAFSALYNYLSDDADDGQWGTYQPVSVFGVTSDNTDPKTNYTSMKIAPVNSFTFASTLINELNSYGCNMESFLGDLVASTFAYETIESEPVTTVNSQDSDVISWFAELEQCYTDYYDSTMAATTFLDNVKTCYYANDYAYVYYSPVSVSKVMLMNYSVANSEYNTPYTYSLEFDLPNALQNKDHDFSVVDYIVSIIMLVAVVLTLRWVVINKVLKKGGSKLKVDLDGDAIAERAVWEMHGRRGSAEDASYNTNGDGKGGAAGGAGGQPNGSFDMEYYYYRGATMLRQTFTVSKQRSWLEFFCCMPLKESHRNHSMDSSEADGASSGYLHQQHKSTMHSFNAADVSVSTPK